MVLPLYSLVAWFLLAVIAVAFWGAWLGIVLSGRRFGCVAYFWHQWRPMDVSTRKSLGIDRHVPPERVNGYGFFECSFCGTPDIKRVPSHVKSDKTNVPLPDGESRWQP